MDMGVRTGCGAGWALGNSTIALESEEGSDDSGWHRSVAWYAQYGTVSGFGVWSGIGGVPKDTLAGRVEP